MKPTSRRLLAGIALALVCASVHASAFLGARDAKGSLFTIAQESPSLPSTALGLLVPSSSVVVEGHAFSFGLGGMISGALITCLEDSTLQLKTNSAGYFSFLAAVNETLTLQLQAPWYTTTQTSTLTVPPEGFTGVQNEVTFQVAMTIVFDLLEAIISVKAEAGMCQFCVTVCAYNMTLHDDPQGEANTTVTIEPTYPGSTPFYFGVTADNKTNPFIRGLNETSLDGGVLFLNVPPSDQTYVIRAHKDGKEFSQTVMKCVTPGRFVNGSPPQSPRATQPDDQQEEDESLVQEWSGAVMTL